MNDRPFGHVSRLEDVVDDWTLGRVSWFGRLEAVVGERLGLTSEAVAVSWPSIRASTLDPSNVETPGEPVFDLDSRRS